MRSQFFAWFKNPNHPSRQLPISEDVLWSDDPAANARNNPAQVPRSRADDAVYAAAEFPIHREMALGSPLYEELGIGQPPPPTMPLEQFLRTVYQNNPALIHLQDDNGMTPLHVAASSFNKPAIEKLLQTGAAADLQRRDNLIQKTPLEMTEFICMSHTRTKRDALANMLGLHVLEPYPVDGLKCAYVLRKAAGETLGTEAEYIKQRQWGCTCGQCTEGWLSRRMRFRIRGTHFTNIPQVSC